MIHCAFCPATVPDVDAAIVADWIPSFWIGNSHETGDPVCSVCQSRHIYYPEDGRGEPTLREKGKASL